MDLNAFGSSPFTLAEATAAGITRGWLRSSRFRPVFSGVFVAAGVEVTPLVRARAALLLAPGAVLSHHSAALAWGATAPDSETVHLSVRRDRRALVPRVAGLTIHEVREVERTHHDGLDVTRPERTFVDLAPYADLAELVTTADSLVRRTPTSPHELIDRATTERRRGIRRARQAAGLVRAGTDSPMESRLRMLLVLAGLPEPVVNQPVYFDDGGWLARPDLQYPLERIAIEYDGRHHLADPRQWRSDIGRRENLEREGWRVRVVTASDYYRSPMTVLSRIHADLLERRHPHVPRTLDLSHLHRAA